jgi:hypothetical protein
MPPDSLHGPELNNSEALRRCWCENAMTPCDHGAAIDCANLGAASEPAGGKPSLGAPCSLTRQSGSRGGNLGVRVGHVPDRSKVRLAAVGSRGPLVAIEF